MADEITITFEIEPIVKLHCVAAQCKFNVYDTATCDLKRIIIDEQGKCKEFSPKPIRDE